MCVCLHVFSSFTLRTFWSLYREVLGLGLDYRVKSRIQIYIRWIRYGLRVEHTYVLCFLLGCVFVIEVFIRQEPSLTPISKKVKAKCQFCSDLTGELCDMTKYVYHEITIGSDFDVLFPLSYPLNALGFIKPLQAVFQVS